jgi:hypothetical protein
LVLKQGKGQIMLLFKSDYSTSTHTDQVSAMRDALGTLAEILLAAEDEETAVTEAKNSIAVLLSNNVQGYQLDWLTDRLQQIAIDVDYLKTKQEI